MILDEMKALKQQYGYSNLTISEKSGVPFSTVQKVFGGSSSPRQSTLEKLQKAFVLREESHYTEGSSAISSDDGIPVKKDGEYTLDDYYALPEERRVELIDGVFYDMATPTKIHQTILAKLHLLFANEIARRKGPCRVFLSPSDVQLDGDNRTMLQPDLFILCKKEQQQEIKKTTGAPDFVVEILSPSTRRKDMVLKLNKYLNAGVREYWIVDPKTRKVMTYDLTDELIMKTYDFSETIPVGIYDGKIKIPFSEVLAELVDIFGEDF